MTTRPTAREHEQRKASDAIRDARQDPVAPLRRRQADLAAQIEEWTRDNLPAEDVEGLIERHVEESRSLNRVEGPKAMTQMVEMWRDLRPPVIHGLVRQGETMNVIAPPKAGKSWLVTDLALSIVVGRWWLGSFRTVAGNVLILDNELHPETSAHRIPKVAEARGIALADYGDKLFVENMRGQLQDVLSLGSYFARFEPGQFQAIVLDAFYRFMPRDSDENDNGTMAAVYNSLDSYAAKLNCSFILIHHSTKGSQSGKSVVDVGAGAGAQSRAADTHLILRQHEEAHVVVLDAAVRSFPPVDPICLRWSFPIWTPDGSLDPAALRPDKPRRKKVPDHDAEPKEQPWTAERFVAEFCTDKPANKLAIVDAACTAGLSDRKAESLLKRAAARGIIHEWPTGDRRKVAYATAKPPEHISRAPPTPPKCKAT
ncbi:MAG TPA: AAA family ATPase [Pirellulaceae bacterium]|jgi:hypothetical protein